MAVQAILECVYWWIIYNFFQELVPPFGYSLCVNETPTYTSIIQELIMQGMQQKLQTPCLRFEKNTWYVESHYNSQPPKYFIIANDRFKYINNDITKGKHFIPMDMTIMLGIHTFSLHATIDHQGPHMYSGHHTTSVNCCENILMQRQHKYGVWNEWYKERIYCICSNV